MRAKWFTLSKVTGIFSLCRSQLLLSEEPPATALDFLQRAEDFG